MVFSYGSSVALSEVSRVFFSVRDQQEATVERNRRSTREVSPDVLLWKSLRTSWPRDGHSWDSSWTAVARWAAIESAGTKYPHEVLSIASCLTMTIHSNSLVCTSVPWSRYILKYDFPQVFENIVGARAGMTDEAMGCQIRPPLTRE